MQSGGVSRAVIVGLAVLAIWILASPGWAAVESQVFTLSPGWNAVFLEVQPSNDSPGVVFSDATMTPSAADLQSVWRWNPRTDTVEFIQDPSTLVPGEPQWMAYYPGDPSVSNLHAIYGETAYLVHLGGSTNVTWTITGEPTVPRIDWKDNSFNFVGFHLTPGQEPLYLDFFSSAPAHANEEIYRLDNATDSWVAVTDPTVQMRHGEAFWVYSRGHSEFLGPLVVQLEQGSGLHYGTALVEQDLRLLNRSALDRSVSITASSGAPQLHYWEFDPTHGVARWTELTSNPLVLDVDAGEMQKLRLGVRRSGIAAGSEMAANIAITDGQGSTVLLPVTVTGIDPAGLWVGYATIRNVSQPLPATPETCGEPTPTGSEFSFRLIVHVDEGGQARLLQEVVQLWQEGTWKPDPNDLGTLIPDEPGSFVLLADDDLIPFYSGAALRDGQPVGRRISSPAFAFYSQEVGCSGCAWEPSPWAFDAGGAFALGSSLSRTLHVPADDPSNPFRHLYHPDHKLPTQSYEITRTITLQFRDEDDSGAPLPGIPFLSWGSSEIGGLYEEEFLGLNRSKICVSGTFLLRKVSDIGELKQ